ncbi:MAG TPA: hypothetical protein VIQ30_10300 [Pseudonocardia sp.]|jgi:hypothetical protein
MVSRGRHLPGRFATHEHSSVLQIQLPAHRLDQLIMLADRDGTLATRMATDLLIDHLDRLDPDGDFLTAPADRDPGGGLASITRFPAISGKSEDPEMPVVSGHRRSAAAVIQLRPGNGCH